MRLLVSPHFFTHKIRSYFVYVLSDCSQDCSLALLLCCLLAPAQSAPLLPDPLTTVAFTAGTGGLLLPHPGDYWCRLAFREDRLQPANIIGCH